MTEAEARAYNRAYDIATSRAESRRRLGLPIERVELRAALGHPSSPVCPSYCRVSSVVVGAGSP
jgi:hypothetical protein